MARYLDMPEATDAKLRHCEALGMVAAYTGDQGVLDADGYLTLQGRQDGMAKVNGFRVFPAEILAQLDTIEGVVEAVVLPVKADGATQLVAFLLVPEDFAMRPNKVRMALGRRLPAYMVPGQIHLLHQFPRTSSGKPDRLRLASDANLSGA